MNNSEQPSLLVALAEACLLEHVATQLPTATALVALSASCAQLRAYVNEAADAWEVLAEAEGVNVPRVQCRLIAVERALGSDGSLVGETRVLVCE